MYLEEANNEAERELELRAVIEHDERCPERHFRDQHY